MSAGCVTGIDSDGRNGQAVPFFIITGHYARYVTIEHIGHVAITGPRDSSEEGITGICTELRHRCNEFRNGIRAVVVSLRTPTNELSILASLRFAARKDVVTVTTIGGSKHFVVNHPSDHDRVQRRCGLNTDNHTMFVVIIAVTATRTGLRRRKGVKLIVTVARTAPTPVEMEIVVRVITIADEAMAVTCFVILRVVATDTIVHDRPLCIQFLLEHRNPFIFGPRAHTIRRRAIAGITFDGRSIIAEELRQRSLRAHVAMFRVHAIPIDGIGTTTAFRVGAVLHINRHAAVVHQRGHSCLLSRGRTTRIAVCHVLPIVGRSPEINGIFGSADIDGMGTDTLLGPLPVFHNLRHGRSHTADVGVLAAFFRAEVPVGVILVPCGLDKRSHNGRSRQAVSTRTETSPFAFHFLGSRCVLRCMGDLLVITAQPMLQVRRHVIGIERTRLGVREDRTHHIVRRNHHPSFAVRVLIDVEIVLRSVAVRL